jgi:DNA-binding GntR family transcriptional regulator
VADTAIVVETVADAVYDRVRTAITSGAVLPGSKISLRSIAGSLSVSTMPVREALKRLQAEGLVVFERRSVTVVALSPQELEQVFLIRLRLEQLAAEWALENLGASDVDDLRAVLDRMADEHLPAAEWRPLNRRFHERFYECARSPHLLDLIHSTWNRVEPYMSIYASTVEDFSEAHRQHLAMLELIEARDLPGLLAETRLHLEHTSRTVGQALADAVEHARPTDPEGWTLPVA